MKNKEMAANEMQDRLRKSLQIIKTLQEQLAEKRSKEKVSILGASFTLPGGNTSYEVMWHTLHNRQHAMTKFPQERVDLLNLSAAELEHVTGGFIDSIDQFDPAFFNIGLEEAKAMDPQHRILLEQVWRAFEDSNINIEEYRGKKVGVFVALSNNDYSGQRFRTDQEKSPYDFTGNILATAAGRISYTFDFRGPTSVVDTACSSALVAMDEAFHALIEGRCDLAVVAGINLILDLRVNEVLRQIEATSPEGFCKPLDASANGYTRSEGGAAFVLKRSADVDGSWEKPVCEIVGSATNHDGKSNGFTAPNGKAQEAVIKEALRNAGIKPSDVDFIELHGTGTRLGDPIEIEAIRHVFTSDVRPKKLFLGAVKSNLGHLECAAGFAGLVKVILTLQHKALPPTVNITRLNPLIEWHNDLDVPLETLSLQDYEKITAGISSFGISGTNAHLIVRSVNEAGAAQDHNGVLPLLLSAPTEEKLHTLVAHFQSYLRSAESKWEDICSSAAVGRKHWTYRASVIAGSTSEAAERLNAGQIAYSHSQKIGETKEQDLSKAPGQDHLNAWEIQQQYLSGKEMIWREVFPPITKKTVLPGLPFSKRHCWVYKNAVADKGVRMGKSLTHPFLERMMQTPSEKHTYHFMGSIDLNENRWLEGHQLFNKVVFPGAGILELVYFAGQSVISEPIQVENLRIIEPTFIDTSVSIWVELKQLDKKYSGLLFTQTGGAEWVKIASFDISAHESIREGQMPDLKGQAMDIQTFYERCNAIGISYKDRFAQLQEVSHGQGMLLGKLHKTDSNHDFLIGPDVLDNCFQVFGVWLMEQFGSKAFVPTDTKAFRFYQKPQGQVDISVKLPERGLENGKTTASFSIYSSNGLCAELIDFSVMQVDKDTLLQSLDRLDNHLYEIQWEAQQTEEKSSASTQIPAFKPMYEDKALLERSATTLTGLDLLADEFIAHIFYELGLPRLSGKKIAKSALWEEVAVSEKHSRLFTRLLDIGVENQWLNETEGFYEIISIPQPDISGAIEAFQSLYPHAIVELKLLAECALNIPLVLGGKKDPLEILFPGGSTEVLSGFYNCDPFLLMYDLCRDTFSQWLEENGAHRKLKILEIGAGTGSTTKKLLPLLKNYDVTYEFTDISPLFLTIAQEELSQYPSITYRLLNIEESVTEQGFELESYDLIIASNVLHATRDLTRTFGKVSSLLKNNGSLFMLEGTMAMKWIDLIFGLTSGWWLFSDTNLRTKHATLSATKWRQFLTSTGFALPQCIEPVFDEKTASGQSVIWTQKRSELAANPIKINWLSTNPDNTNGEERTGHHNGPFAIHIAGENGSQTSEYHTKVLLHLVDQLKDLLAERPIHKRLFIFYAAKGNQQIIGFWRVLQNEWKDWDINLVLAESTRPELIQTEMKYALKGECSRWNGPLREVLRLKRRTLEQSDLLDFRNKKVLVTGASGGLGQAVIRWLLEKGASRVTGVSRSKAADETADRRVEYHYADLLDWIENADLSDTFAIFHLAGTLDNQLVVNQTSDSLRTVLKPKIDGASMLRQTALRNSIPHLIHFGSSASWLGTIGQANHAYANFDLTDMGYPTSLHEISILWGAWTSGGAVKKYDAEAIVARIGMSTIEPREGLSVLDRIIGSGYRQLGVFQLDWATYQNVMKSTPFIQDFMGPTVVPEIVSKEENTVVPLIHQDTVANWLEEQLSYTLGYESQQSFDHGTGFFDLGLDSLTTLDLIKRIETRIGSKLPTTILFKYPTIRQLSGFLLDQYGESDNRDEAVKDDLEAAQFIDHLFNDMIDEAR